MMTKSKLAHSTAQHRVFICHAEEISPYTNF